MAYTARVGCSGAASSCPADRQNREAGLPVWRTAMTMDRTRTERYEHQTTVDWGPAEVVITVRPVTGEPLEVRVPQCLQGSFVFHWADLTLFDDNKDPEGFSPLGRYAVLGTTDMSFRAVGIIEMTPRPSPLGD
jgi:hypothetical protein